MTESKKGKLIFCTPSLAGPTKPYIKSMEDSLPLIEAAGWEHDYVQIIGVPYISAARATMTRTALDDLRASKCRGEQRVIIYLDYDLSWDPEDLLTLLETEGDVVAGTYRCKIGDSETGGNDEQYMGKPVYQPDGKPTCRATDGAISASLIPAGFLKVSIHAINEFMLAYPDLCYGPLYHQSIDLFNHGAYQRIWWGEDYSFARRWKEKCGDIWLIPNLNINHWSKDEKGEDKVYKGNYHEYLMKLPGANPEQYEQWAKIRMVPALAAV